MRIESDELAATAAVREAALREEVVAARSAAVEQEAKSKADMKVWASAHFSHHIDTFLHFPGCLSSLDRTYL